MPNGRGLAARIPRHDVRRFLDSISGNPVVGLMTGGDPPVGVVQRKPIDLSHVKVLADSFPQEELFVEEQHDDLIPGGSAIVIHFGSDWVWVTVKDSIFPTFRTFWLERVGRPLANSRVTIHMTASLDGFIARKDGSVDWLETSDHFADGDTLDPQFAGAFLEAIDCYVMGSRTYETALRFESQGLGGRTATNPHSFSPVEICPAREVPSCSTQAISRSS